MNRYHYWPLIFFLGNGCATFHAKPIDPEVTARQFETRRLTDAGLQAFMVQNSSVPLAWPLAAWDFPHLTLAAFYYHSDLDLARAQWSTAKAAKRTAQERPNPTLNLAPEYSVNPDIGFSPWVLVGILDIPLETAGKRRYRMDQAQALADAARLHVTQAAWLVRSRVRAALLAIDAAQRAEAILQSQTAKLGENRKLFERRSKEGFVSPLALTQAEVLAGRTELLLADAQRQELDGRHQLAAALGVGIQALEHIPLVFAAVEEPTLIPSERLAALRQEALLHRPDLLESLALYAAAQAALQLEIAKQYPDFHIGPGFDYDQGNRKWALSASSVLPIFNHNQGAIAEATAKREEAAARFMALQEGVMADVDRAAADYLFASQKLATANALLAAHRKQDARLQRLLRPGDVSRLTLFRAQLDLDSTRLVAADAWTQFQMAEGALEEALGQPLSNSEFGMPNAEYSPRVVQNPDSELRVPHSQMAPRAAKKN